ncbi:hypothetical protein V8F20_010648 [Naviculisporaceae sp. PSN 640]
MSESPQSGSLASLVLSLQTGWRRAKDWCIGSYRTCDTGEFEPSWVTARRANLAHCGFYRLPAEILLQILGELDNVSRAMVMRTCGLLLSISFDRTLYTMPESPRYNDYHSIREDFRTWPPFAPHRTDIFYSLIGGEERLRLAREKAEVKILLDRDRFCSACRQFREDGRYRKALQALREKTFWCRHCRRTHTGIFFSARQRNASKTTRVCVLAEGRAPFCVHMGLKSDSCPGDVYLHPDHGLPNPYMRCIGGFEVRPRQNRAPYRERSKWIFDWSGGLEFRTTVFLFHLGPGAPLTRASLQEKLIAKEHILDRMLCPHVTARDGQLLLPFGPNRCVCFEGPRWIPHNHEADHLDYPLWQEKLFWHSSTSCCRCHAEKNPGLEGYFLAADRSSQHHEYSCVTCRAEYSWRREGSAVFLDIRMCTGEDDPVSILAWRRGRDYSRPQHWLYNIHPESWGVQHDEELHRVAWCEDINCMSRWRWKSLTRLLEEAF